MVATPDTTDGSEESRRRACSNPVGSWRTGARRGQRPLGPARTPVLRRAAEQWLAGRGASCPSSTVGDAGRNRTRALAMWGRRTGGSSVEADCEREDHGSQKGGHGASSICGPLSPRLVTRGRSKGALRSVSARCPPAVSWLRTKAESLRVPAVTAGAGNGARNPKTAAPASMDARYLSWP